MAEYTIIIEYAGTNFAAYVPDLPGCVGAADTIEELEELMRESIEFHIEGMLLNGEEVPAPHSRASSIRIAS
ncbi:MAG: type II toxin-antitoxin system HicB family antitoxin [Acidimicrobiaceae bacterium]|nr:type II toxin-antitoxin system HicB family antitoxin [Acidimicrobiaceae bacterium]